MQIFLNIQVYLKINGKQNQPRCKIGMKQIRRTCLPQAGFRIYGMNKNARMLRRAAMARKDKLNDTSAKI